MRIAFACPSYGPIEPRVVHAQRHAIMMAWANGIEVHGDTWIDRAGWDEARNVIANAIVQAGDFDGVFWCDADTVLPPEAIVELAGPGLDVVTGIYYGRRVPYEPQIHIFNEELQAWSRILKWPSDGLFPVHGHGFGCVYTSTKALKMTQQTDYDGPPSLNFDTGEVKPVERPWWFRTRQFGEDLTWCHYARSKGLILWCNPKVVAGHLGEVEVIDRKQFEEWYKNNKTESQFFAMTLERAVDGEYRIVPVAGLGPMGGNGKEHSLDLEEHLRMTPSA